MLNVESIIEKATELRKKMQEDLEVSMKEVFKEFWTLNPGITAVVWTQYAPYFNDGDPCYFGVNDIAFTNATGEVLEENINSIAWADYADEEIDGFVSFARWSMEKDLKKNPQLAASVNEDSIKALPTLLNSSVMEDVMEATFGNDALVIATREGFEVREYVHD